MSIIRSDNQADSLKMLKLVIETRDYYRAMAELLAEQNLQNSLDEIANERATYIEPFENVVRQLGELPAKPDPDKEFMQQLGGEITKLFSIDSTNSILDRCLDKEQELAEVLNQSSLAEQSADFKSLLNALAKHVQNTKKQLHALKS